MAAKNYSPNQVKINIACAAKAGLAQGKTMRKKVSILPSPSSAAADSKSLGKFTKNCSVIVTTSFL